MGLPDIIKLFTRKGRKFYFFLVKTAGYWPHNTDIFHTAFVHKSAGKKIVGKDCPYNNERLEYLGDAVIETVVSDILYHKYPTADEGFMSHIRSNMVCRARLNSVSFALGLDKYVVMASRRDMENSHISGDVLEAFVAAIYLDGGMRRAFKFVERTIANPARIEEALHDTTQTNYKSMLVNLGEQNDVEVIFSTRRTENARRVDDEALNFYCEVTIADFAVGQGLGRSKKQAEQRAAEIVCKGIESGKIDLARLKDGTFATEPATADATAEPETSTTINETHPDHVSDQPTEVDVAELLDEMPRQEATLMAEKAAQWTEGENQELSLKSHFKEFAEESEKAQKEAVPVEEQPANIIAEE